MRENWEVYSSADAQTSKGFEPQTQLLQYLFWLEFINFQTTNNINVTYSKQKNTHPSAKSEHQDRRMGGTSISRQTYLPNMRLCKLYSLSIRE